jgi:hypothetical protein
MVEWWNGGGMVELSIPAHSHSYSTIPPFRHSTKQVTTNISS